jgi:hypothetical protein
VRAPMAVSLAVSPKTIAVTSLITEEEFPGHPGVGSFFVDGAFTEAFLHALEHLHSGGGHLDHSGGVYSGGGGWGGGAGIKEGTDRVPQQKKFT